MVHSSINAEAVETLYRQYASDVYKFALVSTRNQTDAEDVVQEVFLRVFKNWRHFRGDAHVKTWIFQITHNYLVDVAKKKTKEAKLALDVSKGQCFGSLQSAAESAAQIDDILNELSQNQRKVVALRIVQDLSVADTAHLLQCSEGKVRTDTHRALKRLRTAAR